MNLLKLSWRYITHKPLATLLSILLLALGVALVSILLLVNKQVQEKFDKSLAGIDLVIGAKGSPLQMILCSMYHIDAPTGNIKIKNIKPFLNPKHPVIEKAVPLSLGDSYKGFRIVGTEHSLPEIYQVNIKEGKLWSKNYEAAIGASVARILNLKLGDTFTSSHGFEENDEFVHEHGKFTVTGIFEESGTVIDQLLLTNSQSIWDVHDHDHGAEGENHEGHDHHDHEHHDHEHGHDHEHDHEHDHHHHDHEPEIKLLASYEDKEITSLLCLFRNNNFQALNMARSINDRTEMQAATPAMELNRLYLMMGVGEDALRYLAYIIIFVSGLSVFISLYNSLKERKYEMSLMRVMGASPSSLFILTILEGIILAFIGYLLGILLSHIGMSMLAGYMQEAYKYTFNGWIFLKEELYLLVGALGIGFIAAIIPAYQAFKTQISDTLLKG